MLLQECHGNATCADCGNLKRPFQRNINLTGLVFTGSVAPVKQRSHAIFAATKNWKQNLVLQLGKHDMLRDGYANSV